MPDAGIVAEMPVFGAFLGSSAAPGSAAQDAAEAALALIRAEGWAYAKAEAPTSLYANLSGNALPGQTRLSWLRGQNKCNQFVGDALTAGGYRMPTLRMPDGSEHYMMAEALPRQAGWFQKLNRLEAVRPGDIYVLDYGAAAGVCGAHTEVILGRAEQAAAFSTAGAHRSGASVSVLRLDPARWQFDAQRICWSDGEDSLYLLRPLRRTP